MQCQSRVLLLCAAGVLLAAAAMPAPGTGQADDAPSQHLSETGLPLSATGQASTHERLVAFTPQYPLWSDGTEKRRWLQLPTGAAIDASDPDAWQFPPGTKLWKEFALGGRPIETRLIERRSDGAWRYAVYVWNAQGTDAELASPRGASLSVAEAPNGRYRVPSRGDCLACHGGAPVPVLGLGALQLSPDRDPLAPNRREPQPEAADLRRLVEQGWVRGLPQRLIDTPPRIAADSPVERAALGHLHGNCAHCHNASGRQVPVRLNLAHSVADPAASRRDVIASAVDADARYRAADAPDASKVIAPGSAASSVLLRRMQSPHTRERMPPLGTERPDPEGLALVHRWIDQYLPHRKETRP
jgi:hypothetical protein